MNTKLVQWVLRIGVAGEFIGHGFLAIGGKADWITWVSKLIGTSQETSTTLVHLIGYSDLVVAAVVLLFPINAVLLWAVLWGFWTALVRPLVGVGWLDFIERFANWAAPLSLLLLRNNGGWPKSLKEWFS